MNIIDIHAHILPGIDDGSRSMDETMAMLQQAYDEGVRAIFATPHCGVANPGFDRVKAEQVLEEVQRECRARFSDLFILKGNELFYSSGILQRLNNGEVNTLIGSDYILVEFASDVSYKELERAMRELITGGYRPVLAHAERYMCLIKDQDLTEDLVKQGVYIQINSSSLMRGRFNKRMRWCRRLVERGLVHFVATDCHNTDSRKSEMKAAIEKLRDVTDEETVRDMVYRNGIRIMKNEYI